MGSMREGFRRLGISLVLIACLLCLAVIILDGSGPNFLAVLIFLMIPALLLVCGSAFLVVWIIYGFAGGQRPSGDATASRYQPGALRKAAIVGSILATLIVVARPIQGFALAEVFGEVATPILICLGFVALFKRQRRDVSPDESIPDER